VDPASGINNSVDPASGSYLFCASSVWKLLILWIQLLEVVIMRNQLLEVIYSVDPAIMHAPACLLTKNRNEIVPGNIKTHEESKKYIKNKIHFDYCVYFSITLPEL
jgi:hypothetical protein